MRTCSVLFCCGIPEGLFSGGAVASVLRHVRRKAALLRSSDRLLGRTILRHLALWVTGHTVGGFQDLRRRMSKKRSNRPWWGEGSRESVGEFDGSAWFGRAVIENISLRASSSNCVTEVTLHFVGVLSMKTWSHSCGDRWANTLSTHQKKDRKRRRTRI